MLVCAFIDMQYNTTKRHGKIEEERTYGPLYIVVNNVKIWTSFRFTGIGVQCGIKRLLQPPCHVETAKSNADYKNEKSYSVVLLISLVLFNYVSMSLGEFTV